MKEPLVCTVAAFRGVNFEEVEQRLQLHLELVKVRLISHIKELNHVELSDASAIVPSLLMEG
jgi:hypothetical protein